MAYIVVDNFRQGLDRRRPIFAGAAGTLFDAVNCHVTRGGDLEKRKAFVSKFALPAGQTFGIAAVYDQLYTFGSGAGVVVPSGITYLQLAHPDGFAMTGMVAYEIFNGKIYAIAQYSDGSLLHFYDGQLVNDWVDGIVRPSMNNLAGIATHLATVINRDKSYNGGSAYNAVASGATITITANKVGTAFTSDAAWENKDGGTDDQKITLATVVPNGPAITAVGASGQFNITGGSQLPGTNQVTSVTVNGVEVLGTAIDWRTSNTVTAANVAAQITNNCSANPLATRYTATNNNNIVTITADPSTGANSNSFKVQVTVAGGVAVDNGGFIVNGGTNVPGTNSITSVTVDGVEILGASIDWAVSNSNTAALVANQISAYASNPKYVATSNGPQVIISRQVSTSGVPVNLTVSGFTKGNASVGSIMPLNTTVADLASGVNGAAGQAQVVRATLSGTFEVGDKFTIILDGKYFGHKGKPPAPGNTLRTLKGKMYSSQGSILNFSGVNTATGWNSLYDVGAGNVNMSNQSAGSANITALQSYQGRLAIFSENAVQVEFTDADPANNILQQNLLNTGTRSPKSVQPLGDIDVFYLDNTGIRSVRARDASNAAAISDVGTMIDPMVRAQLDSLSLNQIQSACSVIEPTEGRYWLALDDTIYVFSYFPSSQVTAWTTYKPGFVVSDFAICNKRIYARSGDTVYLYGGDDNATYDDCLVTVALPFMTASKPGTYKNLTGMDVAAVNTWNGDWRVNPNNLNDVIRLGDFPGVTYQGPNTAGLGHVTHVAPIFTCQQPGYACLSNVCVYFDAGEDSE